MKKGLIVAALLFGASMTTGFTNNEIYVPELDSNVASYLEKTHGKEVEKNVIVRVIEHNDVIVRADAKTGDIMETDVHFAGYQYGDQIIGQKFNRDYFDGTIVTNYKDWTYYTKINDDGSITRWAVLDGIVKEITNISKKLVIPNM